MRAASRLKCARLREGASPHAPAPLRTHAEVVAPKRSKVTVGTQTDEKTTRASDRAILVVKQTHPTHFTIVRRARFRRDMSNDDDHVPKASSSDASTTGSLGWHSIKYTVRKGKRRRDILRGTSGEAIPGRLHGILGPSGSGKTTLLNIIAGRVHSKRGNPLACDITHGGTNLHGNERSTGTNDGHGLKSVLTRLFRRNKNKKPTVPLSYVEQDPKFFSNLTVRETLTLDAKLHGGDDSDVARVLNRLGLNQCAETCVGGDTGGVAVRGVSGGERRRLAIACETLGLNATGNRNAISPIPGNPKGGGIVLADEPTTGLDAHAADKIVERLRETAVTENAIVLAVLHQPRSSSFLRMDDVTLLTEGGRVAYCGPVEGVLNYFETQGHHCPQHHNPAEFLIDLVSVDFDGTREDEIKDKKRVNALVEHWESTSAAKRHAEVPTEMINRATDTSVVATNNSRKTIGTLQQFRLLLGRAWRQTKREAWVNVCRLLASAGLAAAFGGCNRNLGYGGSSVKRRCAVLMQACINTSMLAVCRSLNGFPRERSVIRREVNRTNGGYSIGPYFFSKLLIETPVDCVFPMVFGVILSKMSGLNSKGLPDLLKTLGLQTAAASTLGLSIGALSPSSEMALAIGPCVMVLSIMLGDETGAFAEIPEGLTGVSHLSLIKWAFRGCLASEFEGLKFDPTADKQNHKKRQSKEPCPPTGEFVLGGMGLPLVGGASVAMKAQTKLIIGNAVLTYLVLKVKGA